MNYFTRVNVKRLTDKEIEISWETQELIKEVKIYWNETPEMNGEEKYITSILNGDSVKFDDPDMSRRNYFILKAEGCKPEIVAEVLIPLKGVNNFRDLGGYRTKDGRKVKWNKFFRSAELAGLTKEDLEYFKSLGIKTILDYRSKGEAGKKPDPLIEGIENINISAMPALDNNDGNFDLFALIKESKSLKSLGDPSEFLRKGYIGMAASNEALKKLMECVQCLEKVPIINHCTAGKDRTGIGSALILLALGVPEETVLEDYLLTNVYRANMNKKLLKTVEPMLIDEESIEICKALMEVRQEYIEGFFNAVKERYGSIEEYLEKEFGLTEEKRAVLQQYYLE